MEKQKYLVIIGDIIKSRDIKDRNHFQKVFEKEFKIIEAFETNDIVSSFTITIGDEFQGVLSNASHLFKFIDDLEYGLNSTLAYETTNRNPEKARQSYALRYGIGVGDITTEINKTAAIGMDGPAFYNARKSIDKAKKDNLKYSFESASENDDTINALLQWLSLEKQKWNFRKSQIVKLYKDKDEDGWTQERIAESLKISQPAVSKILKNAPVELSMKTEQLIEKEINKVLKNNNHIIYSMVAEPNPEQKR